MRVLLPSGANDFKHAVTQASDDAILELLKKYKSIAVVGLSSNPTRPSFGVTEYMQGAGYRIIPVNPAYPEVLGQRCYPNLTAIGSPVDVVDCFRKPEDIVPIARRCWNFHSPLSFT